MLHGFVEVGRMELLLTLLSVALLMAAVGYATGQVIMMVRRPAVPVKPDHSGCTELHCEVAGDMDAYLRRHDFSLITNEILSDLQTRVLPKLLQLPTFKPPRGLSADEIANIEAAIKRHPAGRHRRDV